MQRPSNRLDPAVFGATCVALWTLFAIIASWAPRLLDDWYQVAWLSKHELTLGSVVEYTRYNYFNYNPRIGETFLLLGNASRALHVGLTASLELALLFVGHALALGRWPRPTRRDAGTLLVAQALVWIVAPMVGLLYFYRPFTTNYLFGLAFQLLLFVPYRLAFARPAGGHRPGLALAVLAWGWVAGMSNEHTGPAAIVALAALVIVLARRGGGVRAWMITGLVGLTVGYLMLYFAPGQHVRYAGVATHAGPIETLVERGLTGSLDVVLEQVRHARAVILGLSLATLAVLLRAHRRGQAPPRLELDRVAVLGAFLACAALIVATLLASPLLGERLYFAPSVLVALAALVIVDVLGEDVTVRRVLVGIAALVIVYHAAYAGVVHARTDRDARARDAELRRAAPGTVGTIRPFRFASRSRWALGDDLRAEYLRQYVAHEVYGLSAIEYETTRPDLQTTIPWRIDVDVQFDPPLAPDELWRRIEPPLRYVPSRVDRLLTFLRKLLPELRGIAGHRVVAMTATVHGLDAPELAGRPVRAALWRDGVFTFAEAVIRDRRVLPYFLLYATRVPADMTQVLLVACGRARELTPRRVDDGLRLDFEPTCQGHYALLACTADTCWLAGNTSY